MALPKVHRLKRRQEFDWVYRRGKRYSASHLLLRAFLPSGILGPAPATAAALAPLPLEASSLEALRVAVVVSQKVSKRAVIRNRIRRRIQAGLQTLLPRLKAGWLLVITVKPNALECDYHKFLQELEQLLANAEVLDGHS